ncbi:MAG: PKD domain-containing protein [Bacteroidales bacterium]|nr:PKD domain-containing protein [Bacteroidales bacterium]
MKKYSFLLLTAFHFLYIDAQYTFSADKTSGCDSITVKFSYLSALPANDTIVWDWGQTPVDSTFSTDDTLTATFTSPGDYPVYVYLKGEFGPDTIIDINIYRSVNATFIVEDTVVSNGSKYFRQSDIFREPRGEYTFTWNFGDGNSNSGEQVVHTYSSPGTYSVLLTVSDTFGCTNSLSQSVLVEFPPIADFSADKIFGCDSVKVKFSLENMDTDTLTSVLWDFGNGSTNTRIDPDSVLFRTNPEGFTVSVTLNENQTIRKENYIQVYHTVDAEFECLDTLTSQGSINLICRTLDQRYNATSDYSFVWNFEGIGEADDMKPLVSYPSVLDTVTVSLKVINETFGCRDSSTQKIILYPEIMVQNVFTPNGDGTNDHFQIHSLIPLQIKIFNRYGLLVFQSDGKEIFWDGKTISGRELETGIYYYVLKALSNDPGGKYEKTGFIHMFK